MAARTDYRAAVVGGGPAGLAAALALARSGIETVLVAPAPKPDHADSRTAALFAGSIQFLMNLGVWKGVEASSAPIVAIRILDDTGRLFRAPEARFEARDAGRHNFGYNVPNRGLVDALWQAGQDAPGLTLRADRLLAGLETTGAKASLTLDDGSTLLAELVVAADGRKSLCREASAIVTKAWSYDQSAVACTFDHTRPHHGISTELHRRSGPLTTVPLPGLASSLVWVERPAEAQRLMSLDESAFRTLLEARLQGLLGSAGTIGRRTMFPLSGMSATRFGDHRVALVGESGHVIPPIGAQGLNLGLRDAATIAECAGDAGVDADVGGPAVLERYSAARMLDVTSRVWTVDVLNRSLLSGLLPVQLARGAGLYALQTLDPLRRRLVREGLEPTGAIPRLMRPPATFTTASAG